jgi:hypothetical protein
MSARGQMPLQIWLFQLGGTFAEESAGNDQLLDLLGAFEDVQDLPGTTEGGSGLHPDLPSDLRFHAHRFSRLNDRCQRPTEQ